MKRSPWLKGTDGNYVPITAGSAVNDSMRIAASICECGGSGYPVNVSCTQQIGSTSFPFEEPGYICRVCRKTWITGESYRRHLLKAITALIARKAAGL